VLFWRGKGTLAWPKAAGLKLGLDDEWAIGNAGMPNHFYPMDKKVCVVRRFPVNEDSSKLETRDEVSVKHGSLSMGRLLIISSPPSSALLSELDRHDLP
jgi:hypothetical protein